MQSIEIEGGAIIGLPFLGEHADLKHPDQDGAFSQDLMTQSILCAADSKQLGAGTLPSTFTNCLGDINVLFLEWNADGGRCRGYMVRCWTKTVSP